MFGVGETDLPRRSPEIHSRCWDLRFGESEVRVLSGQPCFGPTRLHVLMPCGLGFSKRPHLPVVHRNERERETPEAHKPKLELKPAAALQTLRPVSAKPKGLPKEASTGHLASMPLNETL